VSAIQFIVYPKDASPPPTSEQPPVHVSTSSHIAAVGCPLFLPLCLEWLGGHRSKENHLPESGEIIASLINVQMALFPLLFRPHSVFNAFLLILGVGVAGLVAFARPYDSSAKPVKDNEIPAMPGDVPAISLTERCLY
jgi:hypothetical protein